MNFSSLENFLSPGKPQPQNSGQTNTESCAAFTCSSDGPIFLWEVFACVISEMLEPHRRQKEVVFH